MADFMPIIEMLENLKEKLGHDWTGQVDEIEDALGRLQVEVDSATPPPPPAPNYEAPTGQSSGGIEILGGWETDLFPDCCAIGNDDKYICTGTLIAPNVVVTADHCRNVTRVFLRGSDINKPDEGETLRIAQQYSHPEVDLRVLVLEQASTVPPRHVAQGSEVNGATTATVVGFGRIDPDGLYSDGKKHMVEVPIRTVGCSDPADPKKYGCLPGREIVAGHMGLLLDTCKGDSGGPLYIKQADDTYDLLGATSRGARGGFRVCGDGGVYVRIDLCLDWIREKTGADISGPRTAAG